MKKIFLIWTGKYYTKKALDQQEFESIMNNQMMPILRLDGGMIDGTEFDEESHV